MDRVKVRPVDALADAFVRVSSEEDMNRRLRNYFLFANRPRGEGELRGSEGWEQGKESTAREHGQNLWKVMLVRLEDGCPTRLLPEDFR